LKIELDSDLFQNLVAGAEEALLHCKFSRLREALDEICGAVSPVAAPQPQPDGEWELEVHACVKPTITTQSEGSIWRCYCGARWLYGGVNLFQAAVWRRLPPDSMEYEQDALR
jgi:hypothetical protein